MSEFILLALFAVFLFGILVYLALFFFNESELVSSRLRRVSQMLQQAELDTGVPYFTSLGNYLDVENPAMFLIAKKRAVFRPIVEEEEEEEEEAQEEEAQEEEQSPLDKSSDSEQLSDEGEEGVVSDNSNSSQVLPPPPVDLDQYTPLFQIHED